MMCSPKIKKSQLNTPLFPTDNIF